MNRSIAACAELISLFIFACGPDSTTSGGHTPAKIPLFASCAPNDLCATGTCSAVSQGESACSQPCGAGGACPAGGACGVAFDGTMACLPTCTQDVDGQYVCNQGASFACGHADPLRCDVCGCPSSQLCLAGTGCVAKASVGDPCSQDSDCNTANCSPVQGICRTPVGEACTASNCDLCFTSGSFSYCSRACNSDAVCNGDFCIGYTNSSTCNPKCTAACPGQCQYTSDFVDYYCAADFTVAVAPGAYGYPCGGSPACATGTCYSAGTLDVCSQACATNSDCGAGFACADLPCAQADAGTSTCPVCLAACSTDAGACRVGTCSSVPSTDGTSSMMCDVRSLAGSTCSQDADCTTERCVANRCVSTGGAANGQTCQSSGDCVSNNCVGGECKGTSLIGGSCSTSLDCTVGTCCSSEASAGTCENGC
jgi:hypothetical protein